MARMRSSMRGNALAGQLASSAARAPSAPSSRASSRRPVSQLARNISHVARRRSARSASAGGHASAGTGFIAVMQSAPSRSACARSARSSNSGASISGCFSLNMRAASACAVRLPVADRGACGCVAIGTDGGAMVGGSAGDGCAGTGDAVAIGGVAGFGASAAGDGGGADDRCIIVTAAAATTASATAAPATTSGRTVLGSRARCSAVSSASIDRCRRVGSAWRPVASTRSIARGMPSAPGGGGPARIAAAISAAVWPRNGRWPCSDSCSDTQNEN